MRFSRQEYWSGLPFPSPGDLPNPGIKPGSPALWADTLTFFQSGYIILRSHQESMRFPDTSYPPRPLWVPVFQILAILIVQQYLTV